jgi:hypothetical protein
MGRYEPLMKTISVSNFDEGLLLLSGNKVVRFDSIDITLDDWLEKIDFNIEEDCSPFGYFFNYASLVEFNNEEISNFFEAQTGGDTRATRFKLYPNMSTTEFVSYIKYRVQYQIESGDYPLVVIGTFTDGLRKIFIGYELKGHSWEGVRQDCLGLFDNIHEMLNTEFSNGIFEPLYHSLDEFNSST